VAVTFSILGPFEVRVDGELVAITAARVRALLAVLVLNGGDAVSADRLIEELWPAGPPASAAHALQVYVSEARKALGDERGVLQTVASGYAVRAPAGSIDVEVFELRLNEARVALEAGAPGDAVRLFAEAFALWRGEPMSDFAYEPFAQISIQRLEELRLAAEEERVAAELQLGHHREVLPRLGELVRLHPLREGLREHQIVALYRCGRQADALQAYQDARQALVEELGIDPSRSLQELEHRVLNQDPSLDRPPSVAPVSPRRSILVAATDAAPDLLELAERLAGSPVAHALINAVLLDGEGPEAEARVEGMTRSLAAWRRDASERGLTVRATAFTSADPADDVLRLAAQQDVDLVLLAGEAVVDDAGSVRSPSVLEECAADVALCRPRPVPDARPVLVPFAGAEHDWAALELGTWFATALAVPLRLVGAAAEETRRDASRLLASAALAVQQLSSIETEHVLALRGADAILEEARDAALLVLSLPESWRRNGLGATRTRILQDADVSVLVARRGLRPGGLAPNPALTRFTWSLSRG
jgi:DNA-binding SARP family transcriptional activator